MLSNKKHKKSSKTRRDDIQSFIKDQLENKVSFTTGNRTDGRNSDMRLIN